MEDERLCRTVRLENGYRTTKKDSTQDKAAPRHPSLRTGGRTILYVKDRKLTRHGIPAGPPCRILGPTHDRDSAGVSAVGTDFGRGVQLPPIPVSLHVSAVVRLLGKPDPGKTQSRSNPVRTGFRTLCSSLILLLLCILSFRDELGPFQF